MATPYLGEIRVFSFGFAPKGWLACDGQLLPINQYQALFSLLGTTYGGDGRTTFALPNLQGRLPVHPGNGLVLGELGGESAHTLTILELPQHTHVPVASSAPANSGTPLGNVWAAVDGAYSPSANTSMNPACISNAGSSQAHQNMSPFLTLNFCIAMQGIFPSNS